MIELNYTGALVLGTIVAFAWVVIPVNGAAAAQGG
jgi:hypothetical protein